MKTSTSKSQNSFSWNKTHIGLNSMGSGYDSNVSDYWRTNFTPEVVGFYVQTDHSNVCIPGLESLRSFLSSGSTRFEGRETTLEHKSNWLHFQYFSIAQNKPSLERI